MIMSGFWCLCVPSDHQRMTGNTGSTHGARTLSNPARNARTANDMSSENSVKARDLLEKIDDAGKIWSDTCLYEIEIFVDQHNGVLLFYAVFLSECCCCVVINTKEGRSCRKLSYIVHYILIKLFACRTPRGVEEQCNFFSSTKCLLYSTFWVYAVWASFCGIWLCIVGCWLYRFVFGDGERGFSGRFYLGCRLWVFGYGVGWFFWSRNPRSREEWTSAEN